MISVVIISKDDLELDDTLTALRGQVAHLEEPCEVVVVDASDGRLDAIRERHDPAVRWIQFERPPGAGRTIPHQRNVGVRAASGDIIVFTDCGCHPDDGWLARLTAPLRQDERVCAGPVLGTGEGTSIYEGARLWDDAYLKECPTGNLAFRREVFDAVGGFDESFDFGSDIDFSWRLVDAGYQIRAVPDAVIRHDWGSWRRGARKRQLRRSFLYGKARARLYRKHKTRRRRILHEDPVVIVYRSKSVV